uniref:Uncharacterized protein n=1 Tax=Romanomermis culicivorax TaxID=13658 RepID=A0A915J3B5_ROMCU
MKKKEIDKSIKKSSNSNCGVIVTKIKDLKQMKISNKEQCTSIRKNKK